MIAKFKNESRYERKEIQSVFLFVCIRYFTRSRDVGHQDNHILADRSENVRREFQSNTLGRQAIIFQLFFDKS